MKYEYRMVQDWKPRIKKDKSKRLEDALDLVYCFVLATTLVYIVKVYISLIIAE